MKTYNNLLIHTLAFGVPQTLDDVRLYADRAAGLGASGLELLFEPLPVFPPKEVVRIMKTAGLSKATLCVFIPGDGSFGDPLSLKNRWSTVNLVRKAANHLCDLREGGLKIEVIDGPFAFVLGKTDYPPGALCEVVNFVRLVIEEVCCRDVKLALEPLQESEDGVIRKAAILTEILNSVGSANLGALLDTFHLVKNGQDIVSAITEIDRSNSAGIVHFHANGIGKDLENEGRIPCGSFKDTINWRIVSQALQNADYDGLICLEPFSEAACNAIPPLRTGVVPVTDDSQIAESVTNLAAVGILK